jgi:hypothetical protein
MMLFITEMVFSGFLHLKECLYIYMFMIESIMISLVAYYYNPSKFLDRFLKCVIVLATISLVFYSFAITDLYGMIAQGLVEKVEGLRISFTDYYCNLFYAMRFREPYKNLGPFCEPGLFQIIIIAAIYILVFYANRTKLKHKKTAIALLVLTIITTISALGYLSLIFVFTGAVFSNRHRVSKEVKNLITIGIVMIVVAICIDVFKNGTDGFIFSILIDKVLGIGSTDITTGSVRLTSVMECLKLIVKNPIGYGYTYVSNFLFANYSQAVGATLLRTAAMSGVLPIGLIVFYFVKKAYKNRISNIQFAVLVALYVSISLAQSREIYPAILVLMLIGSEKIKKRDLYSK